MHGTRKILQTVILAALLAACSRPPEPPPRKLPPPVGDFPAFGGGGAMLNVAPAIGGPPLRVRWTYQMAAAVNAAPVIVGDAAYVADDDGNLTALEAATGAKRWNFRASSGFNATPLVLDDTLYIGDLAGTFGALDIATGKHRWTFNAQSAVHAGANGDATRILFGTDSGLIVCLDHAGKQLWTAQADGRINAPPSLKDGRATFTSCDSHVHVLNVEDGRELFKKDVRNIVPGSACATENTYYVGTDQGHVLALSTKDGTVQWDFDKIADNAMVYSSPALFDNTLVVGARNNKVYALHAGDGTLKWSFAAGGDVDASPVISEGLVYVASKDRRLYVLRLSDGKSLWSFEASRPVTAPVAIGRGVVVLADGGGTVYCLEPY